MKKIWIIAPFTDVETLNNRDRFQYIANMLAEKYDINLFTSDFIHLKKIYREASICNFYNYKINLIHEIGYKKNISIKRAISHLTFAYNLIKKIRKLEKPDLIYCAYPMMTTAYLMGKYARKNKIPFILDIQDIWPESISAGININNFIIKFMMFPFTKYANSIYKKADIILGVSQTYVDRAKIEGSNAKKYIPLYIGADSSKFNVCKEKKDTKDSLNIVYIGTLSYSYDIMTAILAISELKNENVNLYILGIGPDYEILREKARELKVLDKTVFMRGFLPYEEMVEVLSKSDVALNAIKGNALQTITNKFSDYVSSGLPLLNCCQSKEIIDLIEKKSLGINYIPENKESLKEKINYIIKNKEILVEYSSNCKEFAEKKFDRRNSYKVIVEIINECLKR